MAKRIVCPNCNAVIMWNEIDTTTRCRLCNKEYKMRPKNVQSHAQNNSPATVQQNTRNIVQTNVRRNTQNSTHTNVQRNTQNNPPNTSHSNIQRNVQCNPQNNSRNTIKSITPVFMPAQGRGAVDILTVPNDSIIANRPLIKTYIPTNWRYQCGLLGDRFDLVGNPFVVSVIFVSPDGASKIIFSGDSFYKHFDPTPQTAAFQGRLDDLTVSHSPSFYRLKSFVSAGLYCDLLAQSSGLNGLSVISEKQPDSGELQRMNRVVSQYISKGFINVSAEWSGKTYSGISSDSRRMKAYAETRVIKMMKVSTVPTLQVGSAAGMFGMNLRPQMVNQQRQDVFWNTQYEFLLVSQDSRFRNAYDELNKIISTLDYLPGMIEARQAAMQLAGSTLSNIAMSQQASMDKRSRIISETNAYTSNIQQQMIANNSASNDRIANLTSEMIRDVNTYHTNDGRIVEASTQYDRVYQNVSNPDIFAAQAGNAFDIGIDFEELRRTNGDY